MKSTRRGGAVLAAAASLSLILAGCNGDNDDEQPTPAGTDTPTETEEAQDPTEDPEETEDDEPDDPGPMATEGAECLIGSWEITTESLQRQFESVSPDDAEIVTTGAWHLVIDESTYATRVDYGVDYSDSSEDEGGTVTAVGDYTLTYIADEESIEFTEVVSASGEFNFEGPDGSESNPMQETAEGLLDRQIEYECSAEEFRLYLTATPQIFTRAD